MLAIKQGKNSLGWKQYHIYLTKGDTAYITMTVDGIEVSDGDTIRCQVRETPNGGELLFDGTVEISGGTATWHIRPEDTEGKDPGRYYWDAQLENGNDIFTFIPSSYFVITDEVTEND